MRNRSGPRVSSVFRPTGSSSQASALTRPATEVQVNRAGPIQTPQTSPPFSCHHPLRDKVLLLLTSTFPQVAGHKAEVVIQNKEKNTCYTKCINVGHNSTQQLQQILPAVGYMSQEQDFVGLVGNIVSKKPLPICQHRASIQNESFCRVRGSEEKGFLCYFIHANEVWLHFTVLTIYYITLDTIFSFEIGLVVDIILKVPFQRSCF